VKSKGLAITAISVVFLLYIFGLISSGNRIQNTVPTSAVASLSNRKIHWGMRRGTDGAQPDFGSTNRDLIQQNQGIAVGNPDKPYVYLTFDNGHEEGYTPKILDVLKENKVPAAFFITGHYLNSAEDLVRRMLDEGHIVGNHTVNHPSMPDVDDERLRVEITKLHSSMFQRFNYEMKFLRPPRGEFSERTLATTRNLGYTTVMWSFAYDDWDKNNQGREEYAKKKILDNIHNGAVILLHSTSRDNSEILDYIIREIKARGFEFRHLTEFKP